MDLREKEENAGKQNKAKPKKKTLQEQLAEINAPPEEEKPKPTKWYMGDYTHNDGKGQHAVRGTDNEEEGDFYWRGGD